MFKSQISNLKEVKKSIFTIFSNYCLENDWLYWNLAGPNVDQKWPFSEMQILTDFGTFSEVEKFERPKRFSLFLNLKVKIWLKAKTLTQLKKMSKSQISNLKEVKKVHFYDFFRSQFRKWWKRSKLSWSKCGSKIVFFKLLNFDRFWDFFRLQKIPKTETFRSFSKIQTQNLA